ncbi:protein trapped in endoderm-1 [Patella vulgata]|uniref:protein trapped in endoderm-1 n=1 Tax=Patella vulgata TaxID=6465 RepID=UPI002180453D|nr:protein trapped in endoderm-1 [Patella vulgata]XP_050413017.1 protein trapped in endoderm-1 [Patella vulgata]
MDYIVNSTKNKTFDTPCGEAVCLSNGVLTMMETITIILCIAGIMGNLLTVFAIVTSPLKMNINSILIGNLSSADVLYCAIVLPLQAAAYHFNGWPLSDAMCMLHAAARLWLIGVNMMLLSAIALYRCLHIAHIQSYHRLTTQVPFLSIIALCWIFPLGFVITPLAGIWGSFSFQEMILRCTFTQNAEKSHKITVITLGYVIPCLFILICYARIGSVAYRTRKRVSRASIYRKQKAQRQSLRLTGMMLCIYCGFLFGTTPYFLTNLFDPKYTQPIAHLFAPFLAWILYCVNPIIYTLMDKNFQNAYKRLLMMEVCKPNAPREDADQETSYAHR